MNTQYSNENFREFLDRLSREKELTDIRQPVDIRHIATLVDQAQTALLFRNVIGYEIPVVSGIIRSRRRAPKSPAPKNRPDLWKLPGICLAGQHKAPTVTRFADFTVVGVVSPRTIAHYAVGYGLMRTKASSTASPPPVGNTVTAR